MREVTYAEDHSQVRVGNGPHVMATLRILRTNSAPVKRLMAVFCPPLAGAAVQALSDVPAMDHGTCDASRLVTSRVASKLRYHLGGRQA